MCQHLDDDHGEDVLAVSTIYVFINAVEKKAYKAHCEWIVNGKEGRFYLSEK